MKALSLFLAIFFAVIASHAAELRGARSFKSGPIQITADGTFVWSVNPDNDSVTRLDTATDEVLEVRLPGAGKHNPKGVSIREDGSEIWVACHDSDRVAVLDSNGGHIASIDLPWGSGPYSVAIAPDQTKALVTLHRAEAAAVIDIPNRRVSQILDHIFWSPMGIAWTDNGVAAWINHLFAPGEHPLQTRIDFSGPAPKVSAAIRITPADPRDSARLAAPYNIAEGGYLNIRGHGAERPVAAGARRELWLPTQYHNINNSSYTPESSMQSAIRRIDLGARRLLEDNADKVILTAVHVHHPSGAGAYQGPGWDAHVAGPIDLAFSRDGSMVYLLHELSRDLVVMPVTTPAVKPAGATPLPEISVGDRPIGLAVSPTAPIAYVNNMLSRSISVVDLATKTELRQIAATPLTGEPLSGRDLRGAKIFHTSDDPRISRNNKVSCASCHINGEHDGRTWNFQNLPGLHGPRSTQTLLGLSATFGPFDPTRQRGQLHRSGDRDEIQDFEHTFRGIQHGGDGFIGASVNAELGAPNAGRSADLDALASYLLSLEPLKRSPHRAPGGALSEAAIRGATFFLGANRASKRGDAGCAVCHVPETGFADQKFYDVGQSRDAAERELNTLAWRVNTPTLVGLFATAPFGGVASFAEGHTAHDSMVATFLDYKARANLANPHGKPDGLNNRQLLDLAEFVLSIDGNMTAEQVRPARDTSGPRILSVRPTSLTRLEILFNESIKQGSSTAWRIVASDAQEFPVTAATYGANGDSMTLTTTPLRAHETYRLVRTSPLFDEADIATGGVANMMDNEANQPTFEITDRISITLGASGHENLTIAVHDTAAVGPGLATWSHDSVWLTPANASQSVPGFVRFAWRDAFRNATGISVSSNIVKASFEIHGEFGDSQRLEIRRCLQRWSDPPTGGDWNNNPTGAPTWNNSAHGARAWNSPGASRLGSNGTSVADYFTVNDLAARADAALMMASINKPLEFAGPLVTDAFRFWFDNPTVDYGYAIRLTTFNTAGTKFERGESGLKDKGPVLKITYVLPGVAPGLDATLVADKIRLRWPAEPAAFQLQISDGTSWAPAAAAITIVGDVRQTELTTSNALQMFRLAAP